MATIDGNEALKCADCERSDSRVTDLKPTQRLEIPTEAIVAGAAEVPGARRYNRRAALVNGVAGMAAIYSATRLDWNRVWEAAAAEAAGNPGARKLVLIYLQGGADSLNMFVPQDATQYGQYMARRANIARTLGASTSLQQVGATPFAGAAGGTIGFANPLLSGAMNNQLYTMAGIPAGAGGLDTLFGDGSGGAGSNLAIFPAADYNPSNHSHFDSRDYWFAGSLKKQTTGWIGRYLDREGSQLNPLQAISLDSSLSKQIRTSRAPVCALNGLQGIQFDVRNVVTPANSANLQIDRLAKVGTTKSNVALARSRQSFGLTTSVSNKVRTLRPQGSPAAYPDSYLSNRLRLAAQLLAAPLGTRVVTLDWGSFDTHGDQIPSMDPQLAVLGASLAAFQADLNARGIGDQVMTVVFSEFGRRVDSNDSGGTDHGAGGPMMVFGNKVKGGLASAPSDLNNLTENYDLRVSTDFRHVYKAIFQEWFATNPAYYLPDLPGGSINRFDGTNKLLKAA
ncbi:MAG: hypothetical protein QOE98_2339 [Gaiellaceae bacterium]|nr:hypothetical protein [Gaiellaceae bacterium]